MDLLQALAPQVAVLRLGLLEQGDEPPLLAHEVVVLEVVPLVTMYVHRRLRQFEAIRPRLACDWEPPRREAHAPATGHNTPPRGTEGGCDDVACRSRM